VFSVGCCIPLFILIFVYIPDFPLLIHTHFITKADSFTVYHALSVVGALFALFTTASVILQQIPLIVFTLSKYLDLHLLFIWRSTKKSDFYSTCLFSYFLVSFSTILQEFILNSRRNYIAKNTLRTLPHILREYKSLEILQKQAAELYGFMFTPLQFLIGKCILYVIYTLLKHGGDIPSSLKLLIALCGINLLIIWPIILETCGKLHRHGCAIISSLRFLNCGRHRKYISRFKKRCRPICIGTPYFLTVKRLTVLKFLKGVIRGTLRMLLAL